MTPAINNALKQIHEIVNCECLGSEHETDLLKVLGTVRNEGYADGYASAVATDQSVFDGDDY